MCVTSMVGDHYNEKWGPFRPLTPQAPVEWSKDYLKDLLNPYPTKAEFEALKKEVQECIALLKKAKLYDEANNEPDCEIEEKMVFIRKMVEFVGLDPNEVLK